MSTDTPPYFAKILSEIHIYAACFQAISNKISNKLKTRNVHSEIVFCLSPKNNVRLTFSNLRTLANLDSQIAASFSNFGITPKTSDLVAVKIAEEALQNSIRTHLGRAIEGENIQFSDISLASLTDWVTVNKLYSLGGLRPEEDVRKLGKKEDFDLKKIEALVLSGMALRGATN